MTDTWQSVFRSLCHRYRLQTLYALCAEIEGGGSRLIHGASTEPAPPVWAGRDQPCQGACLVAFLEATEHNWTNEHGQPATVTDVDAWLAQAIVSIEAWRWVYLRDLWDDEARRPYAAMMVLAETRLVIEERGRAA